MADGYDNDVCDDCGNYGCSEPCETERKTARRFATLERERDAANQRAERDERDLRKATALLERVLGGDWAAVELAKAEARKWLAAQKDIGF